MLWGADSDAQEGCVKFADIVVMLASFAGTELKEDDGKNETVVAVLALVVRGLYLIQCHSQMLAKPQLTPADLDAVKELHLMGLNYFDILKALFPWLVRGSLCVRCLPCVCSCL